MTSTSIDYRLERNAFGQLVLTDARGETHVGVIPVRAFPIAAPLAGISLVSAEGRELAWLDHLDDAPDALRTLIADELAQREFMPEIQRLDHVSTFATPSQWTVQTSRGTTEKYRRDAYRRGGQSVHSCLGESRGEPDPRSQEAHDQARDLCESQAAGSTPCNPFHSAPHRWPLRPSL